MRRTRKRRKRASRSRWAAFPDKKERKQEEAEIAGFRGLPDQTIESSHPSTLTHELGSTFVRLSIDGGSATYFFDTGAWISCMSESEANRLHLTIRNTSESMGQSAGSQVGFRTAVASDVIVGDTHFKDISFAVFPDNQEPWKDLAVGRKGIIGIPILVGLKTLRWEKASKIAFRPAAAVKSVTLPHLTIRIGGVDTVLSPAHILLKSIGAECCVGNDKSVSCY